MKKTLLLLSLTLINTAYSLDCKQEGSPSVIKPMENLDIIATNTGKVDMAPVFSGPALQYTISSHPSNKKNKVTINRKTGLIKIQAEKSDNFNIKVKAKNKCGTASNEFNVTVSEEQ